ncbi:integrator complex subunit 6 homolog [Hyalella azteca]|uniref:Integrator complex subunit 6 homolog n=1 Tax=Hyalella azteca TaxID=294128 RepID=A0A979FMW4_HYAAZ|nr:integrator complex subunit 6 homolog [Hyalella azteca]
MSSGFSSLKSTSSSVNVVVDAPMGVMGVRFEAAYPHEASLQLRNNLHSSSASAEGTTIVSSSPEPSSRSPSLRSDSGGNSSPDRHADESHSGSPAPTDPARSPECRAPSSDISISPRDLMSAKTETGPTTGFYTSSPIHVHTSVPPMTATTSPPPFQPIYPLPLRTGGGLSPHQTQYPSAMPITPTTTPPVTDTSLMTHSPITNMLPSYMSHMMMNTSYHGIAPHTWHPHVYGPPVKTPTSHSIADILGYRKENPRLDYLPDSHPPRLVSEDEPLNLTVKSSVDYGSSPNKGDIIKKSSFYNEKVSNDNREHYLTPINDILYSSSMLKEC